MEAKTMRAVGFHAYGGVEQLQPLTVPIPEVKPDQVRIRVAAAGVNPADAVIRSGQLKFIARLKLPYIPGNDVAGVVEAVGSSTGGFNVGDRVYAMLGNTVGGGYAEYAIIPQTDLAHIPAALTLTEAAAVPLAALTALQALRDQLHLRSGETVLINGAGGGVGSFAVQIAKAMGAQVIAVSSARSLDLSRSLGADEVIDYQATDIFASASPRYDRIFDAVGAYPFARWKPALTAHGVVTTVNPLLGNPLVVLWTKLRGGKRMTSLLVKSNGADLAMISAWIEAGKVRPVIERTYPLADAASAHVRIESKRTRGKLVLVVDETL